MPTNAQVLAKWGEKGFAQHVLNEWDNSMELKVFLKGEPTKIKKIDAGMPRIITGMPLHVTVKHAAMFRNLATTLVANWKDTPVKYAFSPANPGHIEHLKRVLPGRVFESDKSNWDFMMYDYIADACCGVVKNLAIKPPEWEESQFEQYLTDVDHAFEQVFTNSKYRTSDGHVFTMKTKGIMKSGWFMTIAVNSIAQLVCHVLTMMKLGYDDEAIIAKPIFVGGDDVNQDLEGVDLGQYVCEAAKMGIEMEIHERVNLESSEYFSNDIRLERGKFTYYPKRFSKHIEHLKVVKKDDLSNALVSHMENYRHDYDKFALFEGIYHQLREKYPAEFPLSALKSRSYLVGKQYGYEYAM
jgi:hypothetical protein